MTAREFIEKNWKKYTTRNEIITECKKASDAKEKRIKEVMAEIGILCRFPVKNARGRKPANAIKEESGSGTTKGRSLSEFRQVYDKDLIIPQKIKSALKELGNSWLYEQEFLRVAGVSQSDLGNYRDQFANYFMTIRKSSKRAWAGTTSLINQLREMAG